MTGTFYNICLTGNIDDVNKYIKEHNNVNLNQGLCGACRAGHKELVLLMMDMSSGRYIDFGAGLYWACYGGHKEIISLLVSLGADEWNTGLFGAYDGDQQEIILLMVSYGADINSWYIALSFDDIYYLYLEGFSRDKIGKYKIIYDQCVLFHSCFYNNITQILRIEDIAKLVTSY